MRVAVLSAEAVPYSKTGGLGDVAGALPKALRQVGVDSVLITPLLPANQRRIFVAHCAIDDLWVDWRGRNYRAKAFYSEANGSPTFLIDAPEYFHRDSIYGFNEDYERFAFFNHAALALLKRIGDAAGHRSFERLALRVSRRSRLRRKGFGTRYWRNTRTVFSIHNMAYQGVFGAEELWKLGFVERFRAQRFFVRTARLRR